jgi:hypothetical protein
VFSGTCGSPQRRRRARFDTRPTPNHEVVRLARPGQPRNVHWVEFRSSVLALIRHVSWLYSCIPRPLQFLNGLSVPCRNTCPFLRRYPSCCCRSLFRSSDDVTRDLVYEPEQRLHDFGAFVESDPVDRVSGVIPYEAHGVEHFRRLFGEPVSDQQSNMLIKVPLRAVQVDTEVLDSNPKQRGCSSSRSPGNRTCFVVVGSYSFG